MVTSEHPVIDFDDIKVGDTVERHIAGVVSTITVARRTNDNGMPELVNAQGGALGDAPLCCWRLVERTAPDLPTSPTWGWLHFIRAGADHRPVNGVAFGQWVIDGDLIVDVCGEIRDPRAYGQDEVRDFIPVALVPKQLVDDLRRLVTQAANTDRTADGPLSMFLQICGRFLEHADAHGGAR